MRAADPGSDPARIGDAMTDAYESALWELVAELQEDVHERNGAPAEEVHDA